MTNPDARCGNCGNKFSEHYHEDQDYCNDLTNGDVFTDDPSYHELVLFLEKEYPVFYKRLVVEWRKSNGHSGVG